MPEDLARCIEAAVAARRAILADPETTACRVFNDAGDGIPGLVVEKVGDVLVAQLHEGRLTVSEPIVRELCRQMMERFRSRAVYKKIFSPDRSAARPDVRALHTDPAPWLGQPVEPEYEVLENGVRFLVRPYDGFAVGLFLEQRANRVRVRRLAAGRRVLNAFAYTCGFSVVSALGAAAGTVSVDVSKKTLEWGKRNFAVNGLGLTDQTFICSDVFDYYRRAKRQQRSFDLIVLDPPTFARCKHSRRVFVLTDDLERLVAGAVELLAPGGHLLLCTSHRGTSRARLEASAVAAAGSRHCQVLERPRLPPDFRSDADYAKSILARVD